MKFFAAVGRNGQLMLVAGLVAGLSWPQAASIVRPFLTELIVALLFFAALRVDARALGITRAQLAHDLAVIGALQLALPVLLAGVVVLAGWAGAAATMLVLIASASTIAGTPPMAQMLGLSGGLALRLLVIGTLLLPATSLVPLRLAFDSAEKFDLLAPALRLAAVILLSTGGAWVVRRFFLASISARADEALGGVTALLLAIFVLALMDAVQPAILADPAQVLWLLAFTCVASFGLQIVAALTYADLASGPAAVREAGTVGLTAGNRNVALFLAALPESQMEPLMVVVGCYQIPMFLTPIAMRPFYRYLFRKAGGSF